MLEKAGVGELRNISKISNQNFTLKNQQGPTLLVFLKY